jgi:predicted NBD/HSP70 family sugar kinase
LAHGPVDEVASQIVRAALNENEFTLERVAEVGRHLGMGIGRLVKPLSLSEVVLRGSLVDDAADLLLTPAREALSRTVGHSTDL